MADARIQTGNIYLTWTGATNPERQFNNFSPEVMRELVDASRYGSQLKRELLGTYSATIAHNLRADSDGVFRKLLFQQMVAQTEVTVVWRARTAAKSLDNPEITFKLFVSKGAAFGAAWGAIEEGEIGITVHYIKVDFGAPSVADVDVFEIT